jgi:hypothetical protein
MFKPDGRLLVASFATDQVKEYNGTTGAFIRDWLVTGLAGGWAVVPALAPRRPGVHQPVQPLRHDTHFTRGRVFIFDTRNGNFVRAYVQALDSGLDLPTGLISCPAI